MATISKTFTDDKKKHGNVQQTEDIEKNSNKETISDKSKS